MHVWYKQLNVKDIIIEHKTKIILQLFDKFMYWKFYYCSLYGVIIEIGTV